MRALPVLVLSLPADRGTGVFWVVLVFLVRVTGNALSNVSNAASVSRAGVFTV